MRHYSVTYTIGFSAAVCVICSLMVSSTAVGLRSRQQENARLDKQRSVLIAAGFLKSGERASAARVAELFQSIESALVDLKSGKTVESAGAATYDQVEASKDPATSVEAPVNNAGIQRLPNQALIYKVMKDGRLDTLVLPIEGKGLWSTLYGFLALGADGSTVKGITFYQHGETPGLGGEIDNPRWKALWVGRKVFDEKNAVRLEVIKGKAGPVAQDPHRIDGLSGATLTARGVSHLVGFWMGEHGFGPLLKSLATPGAQEG